MFCIVGLGNPGEEYEHTRHSTGRMVLEVFRKAHAFPEWTFDKKLNALVSEGKITPPSSSPLSAKGGSVLRRKGGGGRGGVPVTLVLPQTFMNKSGDAVRQIKDLGFKIKDKRKEIQNLVVIHDDLDIPFGSYKISFNKSSGGHKGVESIIRALKTKAFVRVRVGISPKQKPRGEAAVEKFILGNYTSDQLAALKKLAKHIAEGLTVLVTEGREKAMSQFN